MSIYTCPNTYNLFGVSLGKDKILQIHLLKFPTILAQMDIKNQIQDLVKRRVGS